MYETIKDILLRHQGKSNAISSKQISKIMGFPLEDTQAVSRDAIWNTAKKYYLPLVSCNKGYFIAQTKEELDEYCCNIQKRIDDMDRDKQAAVENYRRYYNEI